MVPVTAKQFMIFPRKLRQWHGKVWERD